MELQDILEALAPLTSEEAVAHDTHFVRIGLTPSQYDNMRRALGNFKLADMVNYKTAQAAFPKLVKAVQLVLAIADNPDSNPDVILLASKTRAQLESALKAAGEEYHSCSREPRI